MRPTYPTRIKSFTLLGVLWLMYMHFILRYGLFMSLVFWNRFWLWCWLWWKFGMMVLVVLVLVLASGSASGSACWCDNFSISERRQDGNVLENHWDAVMKMTTTHHGKETIRIKNKYKVTREKSKEKSFGFEKVKGFFLILLLISKVSTLSIFWCSFTIHHWIITFWRGWTTQSIECRWSFFTDPLQY